MFNTLSLEGFMKENLNPQERLVLRGLSNQPRLTKFLENLLWYFIGPHNV